MAKRYIDENAPPTDQSDQSYSFTRKQSTKRQHPTSYYDHVQHKFSYLPQPDQYYLANMRQKSSSRRSPYSQQNMDTQDVYGSRIEDSLIKRRVSNLRKLYAENTRLFISIHSQKSDYAYDRTKQTKKPKTPLKQTVPIKKQKTDGNICVQDHMDTRKFATEIVRKSARLPLLEAKQCKADNILRSQVNASRRLVCFVKSRDPQMVSRIAKLGISIQKQKLSE